MRSVSQQMTSAHTQPRPRVLCSPGSAFLWEAFVPARLRAVLAPGEPAGPAGTGAPLGVPGELPASAALCGSPHIA